ncbi:uncharacterized protein LOC128993556 [Macrosteles quadrilineatus]|nr:uncharacterized protein LOC128993556 [Macrosteles quadrilineatus]
MDAVSGLRPVPSEPVAGPSRRINPTPVDDFDPSQAQGNELLSDEVLPSSPRSPSPETSSSHALLEPHPLCRSCQREERILRQRMEFFLRDIDADSGDRASWRAIGHLNTTRTELREVLTLADSAIGMASRAEMAEVAPVIWNEIRTSLERILVMTGQQMDDNIIRGQETPTEPQRTITCQICQDALPTIVIQPCHHTLCPACAIRLYVCPFCRKTVTGRKRLYYDG